MRPVLSEWLVLWLRRQGLRDVTDAQILGCLASGGATAEVEAVLADVHVRMLNLGYDWLHALLPHVLAKINRVHYGLLRPHELESMAKLGTLPRSRRFLAVPFVGKDAPSPSSEYAHHDAPPPRPLPRPLPRHPPRHPPRPSTLTQIRIRSPKLGYAHPN